MNRTAVHDNAGATKQAPCPVATVRSVAVEVRLPADVSRFRGEQRWISEGLAKWSW